MADLAETQVLSLKEALQRWSDPTLVEAVLVEESRLAPSEMAEFPRGWLSPLSDLGRRPDPDWVLARPNYGGLIAAWRALEHDMCRRMAAAEFYLSGIQTKPLMTTEQRPIPGVWAAECEFDFMKDTITVGELRFVAVQASRMPPTRGPGVTNASGPAVIRPDITAESVRELADEEVFKLLEDYARRVVEDRSSKLSMPVKVSFMPIIRRKLRHRFETDAARETLGAEAHALAEWIKTKVPSHQTPTAASIENELRVDYRDLKAQSKATIR